MAYDEIENIYNDTWINKVYNKVYSIKIKYRRYCTFVKKYNGLTYDYFICLSDDIDDKHNWINVQHYKKGFKISLAEFHNIPMWNNINFISGVGKVNYELDYSSEDGEVYKIL